MRKKKIAHLKLSIMLAASLASGSMPIECFAASDEVKAAQTSLDSPDYITYLKNGEIFKNSTGLSGEELHLINQGRFVELADKLATEIHNSDKVVRKKSWLAFVYMYLQKCDELNKLQSGHVANSVSADKTQPIAINSTLAEAFALLCEKKLDQAEKVLQDIPAAAMNDAFVNYAFATLAGKQGKPEVAIAYTKRAIELAPDFAWGYRTIAFLQEKLLNQPNEAAKNYAKALVIEPKFPEATASLINIYLSVNNYDQAIAVATDAIKHDGKNYANYYRLADIYLRQWRLQEAAQQLRRAIAIDRSNSDCHRLLALILQTQGDNDAAIEEQKRAVEYSSNKSVDLVQLAAMQLNISKQDAAVDSLKKALDLDPSNMKAAIAITNLLVQAKRYDELSDVLNKCVAKSPKNEAIRLHLGDALIAAGKTDKAVEAYKEAANLDPTDPEPHTRIASIYVSRKDYENAVREYTRSLNINSNSVANLVALGGCEAEMDDYLKAEAAFVTALALHQLTQPVDSTNPPTRTQIIRGLAALLFREGRYADAASQFISLCEMDKDPVTKNLNKFMYAQAVALRDLSKDSFKQLEAAYADLSNEEKSSQKINYIDTLLRSGRYDQSLSLLELTQDTVARSAAASRAEQNVDTRVEARNAPEAALKRDPFYYICLSRAYAGKNDSAKAEEMAKEAIVVCEKEKTPYSDAFCQLGEILLDKGDLDGAEKNANAALGVNTKSFRAYVLLGNVVMKRNQPKLAIEAANKAVEIDPYFIDAYLLLGNAQTAQNDLKGALTSFRKAVDLYPGLLQTHQSLLSVLNKLGTKDEISKEQALVSALKSKE